MIITVQYLEDAPDLPHRQCAEVAGKLRAAAECLPLSHVLIGWNVPAHLLEACRKECESLGLKFLRWHPLLCGEAGSTLPPGWGVIGATGGAVPAYRGKPEFSFLCPNNPAVQEAITRRLEELLREGLYQGFFLDRLRFPSPAAHPLDHLGCFCKHCGRKAASRGIDLRLVQKKVCELGQTPAGAFPLVLSLLGGEAQCPEAETGALLQAFLCFRAASITEFLALCCLPLRSKGMEIGLDCFSPGLTRLVGQDLGSLSPCADWIKVMSYAHTLGPAGIPFELLGLFNYLCAATSLPHVQILHGMGRALGLPLPEDGQTLEKAGLSSSALEIEVRGGVNASSSPILAGIELVQVEGVVNSTGPQIVADLEAFRRAGAAGLALSWDLWHIPLERLALVRGVFP